MVEDMRPGFPLLPIGAFTGEGTGTVDEKHVNSGMDPGFLNQNRSALCYDYSSVRIKFSDNYTVHEHNGYYTCTLASTQVLIDQAVLPRGSSKTVFSRLTVPIFLTWQKFHT